VSFNFHHHFLLGLWLAGEEVEEVEEEGASECWAEKEELLCSVCC